MPSLFPISKYRLVHKKTEKTEENVINLKSGPRAFRYAAYAAKILFDGKYHEIFLHGTGQACSKVVQTVETLRNRINGLHVAYEIRSTEFNDEYHPTEEGLEVVIIHRKIHSIHATVALGDASKIENSLGYLKPSEKVFDEEGFKKKVHEHFERTKERQDKYKVNLAERKQRREDRLANPDQVGAKQERPPREPRDPNAPHRPKWVRNERRPSGYEVPGRAQSRGPRVDFQYEDKDKKREAPLNGEVPHEGDRQPRKQHKNRPPRNSLRDEYTPKGEKKPEDANLEKATVKQHDRPPQRDQPQDREARPVKQDGHRDNRGPRQEQIGGHRNNRVEYGEGRGEYRDNRVDRRDSRPDYRDNRPDYRDNRPDYRDNRPDYRDNRRENREYQSRPAPGYRENSRYRTDNYYEDLERRGNNFRNDRPNYRERIYDVQNSRPTTSRPEYRDNEGRQTRTNNYGPNRSDSRGRSWRNQAVERDEEPRKPSSGGNFRGESDQPFKPKRDAPRNPPSEVQKEQTPSQNRFRERNA